MKCPQCREGQLMPNFIDAQFRAHQCDSCRGDWILIEDFVTWREHNPDYEFAPMFNVEEDEIDDTTKAMMCPATGTFMRKFRITAQSGHRLDYSSAVGGIWLDNGEWELLKKEGVAGRLNAIVTNSWQQKLRETSAQESFSDIYHAKFGQDDYSKLRDIREWLATHPQKADLRAYLLAEDPYSAER
ncbi:zf-TFIIB domain-containing protein [Thaumasiovibrio subtropicus]|uniref:TFIIB-type zinc ribbon-containing protein n=1 Tax=Thaumasiovibrio subtropicus TaxID=1891207 RepID=UPI000B35EC09|nr:zf-TFIIB domain-containing protein [Thaumasiovibrio subtropicus]